MPQEQKTASPCERGEVGKSLLGIAAPSDGQLFGGDAVDGFAAIIGVNSFVVPKMMQASGNTAAEARGAGKVLGALGWGIQGLNIIFASPQDRYYKAADAFVGEGAAYFGGGWGIAAGTAFSAWGGTQQLDMTIRRGAVMRATSNAILECAGSPFRLRRGAD